MSVSERKIMLKYPTIGKLNEFLLNSSYQSNPEETNLYEILRDFFESKDTKIHPKVDRDNFNILCINTHTKNISGCMNKFFHESKRLRDLKDRDVRIFICDYIYKIDVIGHLPQTPMLYDIPVDYRDENNGKFDVIICQEEVLNNSTQLISLLKTNGLIFTDSTKYVDLPIPCFCYQVDELDSFKVYVPDFNRFYEVTTRSNAGDYYINEFDITVDYLLDYMEKMANKQGYNEETPLDVYLKDFISTFTSNIKNELELDNESFNILITCTCSDSIKSRKYKQIIRECIGDDVDFKDVEVYHLGRDIINTSKRNIFRGTFKNFKTTKGKFQMIVSELCPGMSLDIDKIKKYLNTGGILIVPGRNIVYDGFDMIETYGCFSAMVKC